MKILKINAIKHNFKDKYSLNLHWEGITGSRRMIIDIDNGEINIPYEGVKDIAMLCDEFLNDKNMINKYLKLAK